MKLTLLQHIIEWWIKFSSKHLPRPIYKYKIGDSVKYNRKAKIMLRPTIDDRMNDTLIINEIKHKRNEFINYKNIRTKKRG